MSIGPILTRIAWRNVWRNPRRSAVLIGAVAVGVFSFVGSTAFMDGFGQEMVSSAVDLEGGHVQIARSGYHENPTLDRYLDEPDRFVEAADSDGPLAVAAQIIAPGMATSTEQSAGIVIRGIEPSREPGLTRIAERVTEGAYLSDPVDATQVLIGKELADKLRIRLGEKIVLMANDLNNEVGAGAYRVVGLFQSGSTPFDRTQVYLHLEEARRLLAMSDAVTTVSLRLEDGDDADRIAEAIRERLADPEIEVLTWKERNPLVEMAREAYDYSAILLAVILFTAVGFTLANSFLMVIFERIQELGILLAGGIRPRYIRRMLVREAVFIALIGSALGIALSVLWLGYWAVRGLDLSSFAEGLGAYGIQARIYPVFDAGHLGIGFVVILIMVLLSVQYPAWKASRFEAVEAIHHE